MSAYQNGGRKQLPKSLDFDDRLLFHRFVTHSIQIPTRLVIPCQVGNVPI